MLNVPLPCSGTRTWSSCASTIATRSRHTDAVNSLKAPSHDPQSESIADLVSAEVVNGPGVSSIGSVMGSSFGREAVCRGFAPTQRGVLETAGLERSRALEHGVGSRTQVRVHTLEIAQNVQIQRVRLDRLRRSFPQAREVALRGRKFLLAQLRFCSDQLTGNVHIARHENSDREPQAIDDLPVKIDQISLALLRERDAAPDFLGREVHQILVNDVADVLQVDRE